VSRCPSCNADQAYVGILNVECVNVKCVHYSQKQKEEVAAEKAKKELKAKTSSGASAQSAPKITYQYYDDHDSCDTSCLDTSNLKDSDSFDPYGWIDEHYNRDSSD